MTTPMCEDGGPLREWAPLATLLQQIPAKIQNGLFTQDISFTCIDVVPEFIAIGTNHGLVYWFDRENQDLQRLRCENMNSKIVCIQVISTVDYMVAAGSEHGVVTVFQIPKTLPDSLPDSLKPKQKKQVERYTISGLHNSPVTTVEWSKNGMKLFSGDQAGLVVLTEIDFYMHLSKSSELLNEKYSVVQLSYQQGLLLVSTTLRTILVNRNENGKVTQVGQKERKTLGKLGAVFGSRQSYVQDLVIYASRPGLRLWQADKTGTVLKTLIFKDAVRSGHTEVELLNPASETTKKYRGEPTFGVILPFSDDLLVTYSNDIIYVVNPHTIAVTSIVTDLRCVTDVACNKDEIFILEGERNIVRIGYYPESNVFTESKPSTDPVSSLVEMSKPVATGILELTSKLKDSAIVPAIPFHKINPSNIIESVGIAPVITVDADVSSVANAEEALEIPPVVPLNINTPLIADTNSILEYNDTSYLRNSEQNTKSTDRRQIFQKIGQQEFEDVVFTPERKAKKARNKITNGNENGLQSSDMEESSTFEKDSINANETKTTHSSLLALSVDDEFNLKADRNLETIQRDVENKEKLLADVLDFDLTKYMTSSQITTKDTNISQCIDSITYIDCKTHLNNVLEESKSNELNEYNGHSDHTETESVDEDDSYTTEIKKLENLGECRKTLLRDKLTDSMTLSQNFADIKTTMCMPGVDRHDLEVQFNVVSLESMNSAMLEEEDWVLVKDDLPSVEMSHKKSKNKLFRHGCFYHTDSSDE